MWKSPVISRFLDFSIAFRIARHAFGPDAFDPLNSVTRVTYVFAHDYKGCRSLLKNARTDPIKLKLQDAIRTGKSSS